MNKKELKMILTEQREEFQRYNKMIIEDSDSKMRIIAEQGTENAKAIKNINNKVDMLFETVGEMKIDMTVVKNNITKIKNNIISIQLSLRA